MPTKSKPAAWRNRIIGHGEESPDQLLANPKNWRIYNKAQQAAVGGVLNEVGWVQSVVVNQRTGFVVDGHLCVALAISREEPAVPVVYVDLDEREEAIVLASLDTTAAMAGRDDGMLAELVAGLEVGDSALAQMLAGLGAPTLGAGLTDPDSIPEPSEPISKRGDLWLMGVYYECECGTVMQLPKETGNHPLCIGCGRQLTTTERRSRHRILCGDSTDAGDVARLMNGERAGCMWSDPPYGVSYVGKTGDALTIQNDGAAGLDGFLRAAFGCARDALAPGAAIYIARPAGALSVVFGRAFIDNGWRLHEELQWVKDSMVLGHSDYHLKHETVMFGYAPGEGRFGRGGKGWYGDDSQTSVFEVDRPKASPDHPTGKPVALVAAHLANSAPLRGLVFDPFLGSGTTLIAAEQLGRRCYGLEIEPKYVDVICARFEAFTGKRAVLADG